VDCEVSSLLDELDAVLAVETELLLVDELDVFSELDVDPLE
jgi:hypothetical protein